MNYRGRFFAGVDLLGVLDPVNFPREQVNSCKGYLEAALRKNAAATKPKAKSLHRIAPFRKR